MSLSNSSRRLSSPVLAGLEGVESGGLGNPGTQGGVQDSLLVPSTSIFHSYQSPELLCLCHQRQSSHSGNEHPSGEGGHRAGSSHSRLLQPGVCGDESIGGVEAHYRPLTPESSCGITVLPHGDSAVCPSFDSNRGLDDLVGPSRRILSGSCASGVQEVPEVCVSQRDHAIQGPMFQSNDCALKSLRGSWLQYQPSCIVEVTGCSGTWTTGWSLDPLSKNWRKQGTFSYIYAIFSAFG